MIDLDEVRLEPAAAMSIPSTLAMRRLALPLCRIGGVMHVAMADPSDAQTVTAIARETGLKVEVHAAARRQLMEALSKVYGDSARRVHAVGQEPQDDAVSTVERIMSAAYMRRASDIHFDPCVDGLKVRFRVDGELEDVMKLPESLKGPVTGRLKVMSSLDIAERRSPQDGAFRWRTPQGYARQTVDVRMATLPVKHGERMTLRLLESGATRLTLDSLGLDPKDRGAFGDVLASPYGLVLLTGPTGSGKTTTLYAAIRELLAMRPMNILTVEDPIEYEIEGVSQAEVDSGDKVNFSKALRSLLRHDPDVIMIGEIRDTESMDTAVKAALTGHLVLSTLHTNDAVGAVVRLADMGLKPHLAGAVIRLAAAQRLVRSLCPHCREISAPTEAERAVLPLSAGDSIARPRGCLKCAGRGYVGRTGVFELFRPDAAISQAISSGASRETLLEMGFERGFRTLAQDAARKCRAFETSPAEAARIVGAAGL